MKISSKVCVILFVAVAILSVAIFASIYFTASANDWSCETLHGDPCVDSSVWVKGIEENNPYLNGSIHLICSDTSKQKMNTLWGSQSRLRINQSTLSKLTMEAGCQNYSTPCIKDVENVAARQMKHIDQNKENEDWSCQTINGAPCSEAGLFVEPINKLTFIHGTHFTEFNFYERDEPYNLTGYIKVICLDRAKQKANTHKSFGTTMLTKESYTMKIKCLDKSTPCFKDFEICFQKNKEPAVTLRCSYLGNFDQTTSSESNNTNCGVNGAKEKTYWMPVGLGPMEIRYSNEQIYIVKNATVTESTMQ